MQLYHRLFPCHTGKNYCCKSTTILSIILLIAVENYLIKINKKHLTNLFYRGLKNFLNTPKKLAQKFYFHLNMVFIIICEKNLREFINFAGC